MGFEMPDTMRPGPVTLRLADDAVATFYTEIVGLDRLQERGGTTILGAGETPIIVLEWDDDAPARDEDEAGLHHTAIRVPDRAALGALLRHLENQDIGFGAADHGVSEALYLEDPAGNGVEIYRDRPREAWREEDGQIVMGTGAVDRPNLENAAGDVRIPDGTRVGHVHLEVTDIEAATAFYRETLGFGLRSTWDGARFLAAGEYHHHIGLNTWHGRTAPRTPDHQGLIAATWYLDDVAGLEQALRDGNVRYRDMANGVAVRDQDNIEHRFLVR